VPGLDPRGRRAGLFAQPRVRRGVRQPRADRRLRRRRRRGRDRARWPRPGTRTSSSIRHRRRGAADPAPQRLQDRQSDRPRPHQPRGTRAVAARLWLAPTSSRGTSPSPMHEAMAAALDRRGTDPADPADARQSGDVTRPRWPMIVLDSPKGWTGPKVVDGLQIEGTFRAHQVPLAVRRRHPEHLGLLEAWLRSYRPEELFDAGPPEAGTRGTGSPGARGAWAPIPTPTAAACCDDLRMPDFRDYAPRCHPGVRRHRRHARARPLPARRGRMNSEQRNFRVFGPDETLSNGLAPVRGDQPPMGRRDPSRRRVPRADGPRDGDAQRAPVRGLARGLSAHRPARPLQLLRGVHPHRRFDVQPARQVAEGQRRSCRGGGRSRR
jgi:hypothetical protein